MAVAHCGGPVSALGLRLAIHFWQALILPIRSGVVSRDAATAAPPRYRRLLEGAVGLGRSRRRLVAAALLPQSQAHNQQVACVGMCAEAVAHFLGSARIVTTRGRQVHSLRRLVPSHQTCCNLRLCAAKQHVAALWRRRSDFPYMGVRRRQCDNPNGSWAQSFP